MVDYLLTGRSLAVVQIDKTKFLNIKSNQDLADYLGIPIAQLTYFAYSKRGFYSTFLIPKRSGGSGRSINAPTSKLKHIQRLLAETFSLIYRTPDSVHGFAGGRSIATNAGQHVRKRTIIKIDLRDFFPSISAGRVHGLFQSKPFNFNDEVVNTLTNLVCYKGCLPQGAPTSPVLSNMICFRLDHALMQYARQNKLKYTRYADDLTFSSTTKRAISSIASFPDNGPVIINPKVLKIINSNGFAVNQDKTCALGKGTRQVVTGIIVNQKCNFRREDYRYLRGMFHFWKYNGAEAAAKRYVSTTKGHHYQSRFFSEESRFSEAAFIAHVYGLLSYYLMIIRENNRHSRPLQRLWASLHDIASVPVPEMLPERMVFRTDATTRFRRIGQSSLEAYECLGTCFLVDTRLLISARHCAKDQSPNNISAEYPDDSALDVFGHGIKIALPYKEMKDGGTFDWLVAPASKDFSSLPGLTVDPDYRVQSGETVIAYGYADGKNQLRRVEATVVDILLDEIIVDRAFIKGMSGGPVLNTRGDVIGLITYGSGNGTYDRDGRFMPIKSIPVFI